MNRTYDDAFPWSDGYQTGLKEVDDQHLRLVEILNRLASHHAGQASDKLLLKLFDELIAYTAYHFQTEDQLMEEFAVPAEHAERHRVAHQRFVEQVLQARQDAESEAQDVTGQVLAFLTKWLIKHILGIDRQLAAEVAKVQRLRGETVTVAEPPDGARTTEVLLEALDSLYIRLGRNAASLTTTNRALRAEVNRSHQVQQQLRVAATAFEAMEGVLITNQNGDIIKVNQSFSRITGYDTDEVLGRNPRFLKSGRQAPEFYRTMWDQIIQYGSWQGEIWNRRKNGEVYPEWLSINAVRDENGVVSHYVGTCTDITHRKAAEDEIRHLAFYDQLTRLPNRRLMLDRLSHALSSSMRTGQYGALMIIDLDNFKTLNDTMGHAVGDRLLVEAALRLSGCVREVDTVARLGGDEFVAIIENLDGSDRAALQAQGVAEKFLNTLAEVFILEAAVADGEASKCSHHCTASIGIALFHDGSVGIDELMKRADTAMYRAKEAGRNALRFFDPEMEAVVKRRAALEADLRQAIVRGQFVLHYQAQVDAENHVTGAEVLLRWLHPEKGMISPAEFIPLAEETGLILPLGYWVLQEACKQLDTWAKARDTAHLTLAVNVSARQFSLPTFVEEVVALLNCSEVVANRLKLELTESLLLENADEIIRKMLALKEQSVGFSMDDFGTGYSSLSYLKQLPLDQLKIDQSFVRDILTNPNDAAIARTIVALAHSLGLAVIAEGVETEGQRDFLARNGCPTCQGYYFSRPLPLDEFERYAANNLPSRVVSHLH